MQNLDNMGVTSDASLLAVPFRSSTRHLGEWQVGHLPVRMLGRFRSWSAARIAQVRLSKTFYYLVDNICY
jgi:hypothetical protein